MISKHVFVLPAVYQGRRTALLILFILSVNGSISVNRFTQTGHAMLNSLRRITTLLLILLPLSAAFAQDGDDSASSTEAAVSPYEYLLLGDDIVTNYQTSGRQLGFLRVSVSPMVANTPLKDQIAQHEPQIRDALIWILSAQSEQQVRSQQQREAIRKQCLEAVNTLLQKELGQKPVLDVLFTTYMYQ
ncbi:MAG: flagellar basal body-associated FliL family protein [Plesiomonas sp.]